MTVKQLALVLVAIWSITVFVIIGIQHGYGFTMTPELEQEWRVLQICIETDIQIEFCETRYGAIDKPYGEPVK